MKKLLLGIVVMFVFTPLAAPTPLKPLPIEVRPCGRTNGPAQGPCPPLWTVRAVYEADGRAEVKRESRDSALPAATPLHNHKQ